MGKNGMNDFINKLEKAGELLRIKIPVRTQLEVSEIVDRIVKNTNNKALLFEQTGTNFPLLINAFGSEKRMAMALERDKLDDIGAEIDQLFKVVTQKGQGFKHKLQILSELRQVASWIPRRLNSRGACHEIVMSEPDLYLLPILTCWPFDGGPFITLPMVHTVHPETGEHNAGMYRMQVFDKQTTGMHWHLHKDSAVHFKAYKEKGLRMPVSVTLGGHPAYTYAASAPLPANIDEYMLAGFLCKRKTTLVKSITNDIFVPEDADIVIEGYIDTDEELRVEGPFGDHTGFYSLPDMYPVFHVTCITHRKNAVYPTTIVGIPPQEDAWMGKATERIFLSPIRLTMLPEVIDMNLPPEGVFHNVALVKIKKEYEGHPFKVMSALWGAGQMMFNKIMVVFGSKVDVTDYMDLFRIFCRVVDPARDILFSKGPLDVLDHAAAKMGIGGKIGIDATGDTYLERDPVNTENIYNALEILKKGFTEIIDWNKYLLTEGYPFLIISVQKGDATLIERLKKAFLNDPAFASISFVLFIESLIKPDDLHGVVWRSANNIDPSRDAEVLNHVSGAAVLFMDATMKHKSVDKFNREWPNIITMDKHTIDLVDSKWDSYKLGPFISSPSLKYSQQKYDGRDTVKL